MEGGGGLDGGKVDGREDVLELADGLSVRMGVFH